MNVDSDGDGFVDDVITAFADEKKNETGTGRNKNHIPTDYILFQNYPNPFNPATILSFSLPKNSMVTVSVFDLSGYHVRTLINRTASSR